jgi:hypothetical protein
MAVKRKTKKKTTNTGSYIGLKRTNTETNKFLINVMKGASKIFSNK